MTRLLLSATTDLDADAHVRRFLADGDARVVDVVTREWPLIARAALRLRRDRSGDDLITVGEAALLAATFAGRAPTRHIVVGAPRRAELLALRRHDRVRVIISTAAARQLLRVGGISAVRISPNEVPPIEAMPDRADARRRFGLADDTFTIALPGTIRPGSGHRLAIWAGALLAYRDSSWRFLVSGRGDVDRIRTFIAATIPAEFPVFRIVGEGDDLRAIAAADVALFAGEGIPERWAFEACTAAGVATVAARSIVAPEGFSAAATFDPFRARHVARAVLQASDALGRTRSSLLATVD